MAEITGLTFYKYPSGETLDVEEHGENIHSATTGRGIYSEVNGNLDRTNFFTPATDYESTRIRADHIRRGETHITGQERGVETLDYWDHAFGQLSFSDTSPTTPEGVAVDYSMYAPIAGCSVRVYLPYDCEMVLWQWSFFADPARMFKTEQNKSGAKFHGNPMPVIHRAFLDGDPLTHTKRYFPQTWYHKAATPADWSETLNNTEGRNCRFWDMHHLSTNVSKGWHELSARLFMAQNQGPAIPLETIGAREGRQASPDAKAHLHHINNRITFGIRNARALAMMKTNWNLVPEIIGPV